MALTISEAQAVNDLLRWLLGMSEPWLTRPAVTEETAKEAAMLLADHASKALMAGANGRQVEKHWSKVVRKG